ncbi:YidB family protein [Streptomyces xanthophaeus]
MTTESSDLLLHDQLGAVVVYLADQGYAEQVGTWISPEVENVPITGQQLLAALPEGTLNQPAQEAGLPVEEYAALLAQLLPDLVNAATPNGELPEEDEFEQYMEKFYSGA